MNAVESLAVPWHAWASAGWINHLWQSTVVGLVILGFLAAARRLPSGTRRTLGWIALAKFAVPMSILASLAERIGLLLGHWFSPQLSGVSSPAWVFTGPAEFPVRLPAHLFLPTTTGEGASARFAPGPVALAVSLGISVALFSWWVAKGVRWRKRIEARTTPASPEMAALVTATAGKVGLRRVPRCLVTTGEGPGVLGIFSPVIILPQGLKESLAPAEFESILVHELVHLRRRDNLWAALQSLLLSLYWYNPVVWILNRLINAETEKSCDERVLELTSDSASYVNGIMKAARYSLGLPIPGLTGAASMPIASRIRSIMDRGSRKARPAVGAAVLISACAVAVLSGNAGTVATVSSPTLGKLPGLSENTNVEFKKLAPLFAAKNWDGALAVLTAADAKSEPDSDDHAVIMSTEGAVYLQGKNDTTKALQCWEEMLRLARQHPDYFPKQEVLDHYLYVANLYMQKASLLKAGPEQREDYDKSLENIRIYLAGTPNPKPDRLLFYSSLLYYRAVSDQQHVDMKLIAEAQKQAERGLLADPQPNDGLYQLLAACLQKENKLPEAAGYIELLVTRHPDNRNYWRQLRTVYDGLAQKNADSSQLHQEYLEKARHTVERAKAHGFDL